MHGERTRIKKFKNNIKNSISIIVKLGYLILGFNFYLSLCYFGIYNHSFWYIVVNVLSSIAYSLSISLIINILESIFKLNFKKVLFFFYNPCCTLCYFIIQNIFGEKEEYQEINDDDDQNSNNKIIDNQTNITNES